jgi:aminoglycoside phosphotransferase (APT) family kinase protein
MEYVRHHTSIPIPAIIEVHSDTDDEKPQGWMLMERLPGVELGVAWPKMSEDARTETIKQLRSYFEQLHRLRPEGAGWIGSCSGGPAYDHRLDNQFTRGPFPTVSDFHDSLVAPLKEFPRPEWASKYRDQLPDSHDIRFAHADLSWENILVDPETGLVKRAFWAGKWRGFGRPGGSTERHCLVLGAGHGGCMF